MQSFTSVVKEEVSMTSFSKERKWSLLSGFVKTSGTYQFKEKETIIKLQTENAKIAKMLFSLFKELYSVTPRYLLSKSQKLDKKVTYYLVVDKKGNEILDNLQINLLDDKISRSLVKNENLAGGYLAGAFLAAGSCNSPLTSNYHLEIACNSENYAQWLAKILLQNKYAVFNAKIIKRRKQYIVYLKKSDQVASFLILIGAINSGMQFENTRIDREFSNIGNRLQICDTANMEKTLRAAKKQIEDIELIDKKLGIKNIEQEKAKVLASLRLENPEASLEELAALMSTKLDIYVSKSNINHLFRALKELARRLGQ